MTYLVSFDFVDRGEEETALIKTLNTFESYVIDDHTMIIKSDDTLDTLWKSLGVQMPKDDLLLVAELRMSQIRIAAPERLTNWLISERTQAG